MKTGAATGQRVAIELEEARVAAIGEARLRGARGVLAERSQNKRDTQVALIGGKVAVGNIALRIGGRTEDKRAVQGAVHRNILGFGDGQLNDLAGQPTAAGDIDLGAGGIIGAIGLHRGFGLDTGAGLERQLVHDGTTDAIDGESAVLVGGLRWQDGRPGQQHQQACEQAWQRSILRTMGHGRAIISTC